VRPCGADTWLVSGLLRGDEVRDAVGFDVPPGAYETLAGLVLARLGRIPDVDDDLVVDGWQLTVTRREGNRVAELRLHRPPGSPVP
jgi:CBS domain containing-hemolysin-like protein